jgi:predicted phosphoribosyltransferase
MISAYPYESRRHAGRVVAAALDRYLGRGEVVVVGVPRGGVPVAHEIALFLGAPLDILPIGKLRLPDRVDVALGAVAPGGVRVLNHDVLDALDVGGHTLDALVAACERELERVAQVYRGPHPPLSLAHRTVVLVDDGMVTGSTMRAAVMAVRLHQPERIVVATPIAARSACEQLTTESDEVVCSMTAEPFYSIDRYYADSARPSDAEISELIAAV